MKSLNSASKSNKRLHLLFRAVSLLAVSYLIYVEVFQKKDIKELSQFLFSHSREDTWLLFLALFLMPINWLLDTIKWRYLILRLQPVSLWLSYSGTFVGTTISLFTPNRIGGFVGRVLVLRPENRFRASLLSVWSNIGQLIVSVTVGILALIWYSKDIFQDSFFNWLLISSSIFTLMVYAFYLSPALLIRIFSANNYLWRKFKKTLLALRYLNSSKLLVVLLVSLFRYAVFTFQFASILYFFDVENSMLTLFSGVAVVYLITTIVPSVTLAEFGIREVVALQVFRTDGSAEIGVLYASLLIWLINILLPALIGQLIVLKRGYSV